MNIDVSTLDTKAIAAYVEPGKLQSLPDFLLNVIPSSVVDAFAKGEILQVLLFAVLFGFALHKFGGRGSLLFDLIERVSHVLFQIVGFVMKAAPIGAFGGNGVYHWSLWGGQPGEPRRIDGDILRDVPDIRLSSFWA